LASPVEEAKVYIQQQTGPVNADETSHKQQGNKMWVWLATTLLVAVFIIRSSRCTESAKALLGENFVSSSKSMGLVEKQTNAGTIMLKNSC